MHFKFQVDHDEESTVETIQPIEQEPDVHGKRKDDHADAAWRSGRRIMEYDGSEEHSDGCEERHRFEDIEIDGIAHLDPGGRPSRQTNQPKSAACILGSVLVLLRDFEWQNE